MARRTSGSRDCRRRREAQRSESAQREVRQIVPHANGRTPAWSDSARSNSTDARLWAGPGAFSLIGEVALPPSTTRRPVERPELWKRRGRGRGDLRSGCGRGKWTSLHNCEPQTEVSAYPTCVIATDCLYCREFDRGRWAAAVLSSGAARRSHGRGCARVCLLYTSDAAALPTIYSV